MGKLTSYLKDVRVELGKVNWPTREQTTTYTMLVIGVCLVVAIFWEDWIMCFRFY